MTTYYVSIAVFEDTVSNGDVLEVLSGAYTVNTSVFAGGLELVDLQALGSGTIVSDGGSETVSGTERGGTVLAGNLLVESGGSATSETISNGGTATIAYGGTADHIAVSNGGTLDVLGTVTSNVAVYTGGSYSRKLVTA
jgi:autotransporter passenger strand-loop-strand repeat protein